jgi:hypothetical protein
MFGFLFFACADTSLAAKINAASAIAKLEKRVVLTFIRSSIKSTGRPTIVASN